MAYKYEQRGPLGAFLKISNDEDIYATILVYPIIFMRFRIRLAKFFISRVSRHLAFAGISKKTK